LQEANAVKDMIEVKILSEPLQVDDCTASVKKDGAGGIAVFVGTVRNHTKGKAVKCLEFEAYETMAISEMQKIAETIQKKWDTYGICIHHRVGSLGIQDIAVIIAVSCAHRAAAFEACQFAIDTLKQTVPIWKKEIFEDGEEWVSAHP